VGWVFFCILFGGGVGRGWGGGAFFVGGGFVFWGGRGGFVRG